MITFFFAQSLFFIFISILTLKASLLIIDEVVEFSDSALKTSVLMLALIATTCIGLFSLAGAIVLLFMGLEMI